MMLRTLSAACAAFASLTLASSALAAEPVTAKLQQPVPTKTKLIAGGAMFVCQDAVCVATAPGSRTLAAATCKDLAKAFGPVAAFGDERRQFDDGKLGQCNAAALVQTQVANR